MNVEEQINKYINNLTESKKVEILQLHKEILNALPKCKLWFLDGKDESGKTISNPNIGYGQQTIKYANGKTRTFYQVGASANQTGISVYIIGIKNKQYLMKTYGKDLGKANISGYCIKFKSLKDINMKTLLNAIGDGVKLTSKG